MMRTFKVTATYTPNDRSDDRHREYKTFQTDAVTPLEIAIAALEQYGKEGVSEVLERDDVESQVQDFDVDAKCVEFYTTTTKGEWYYEVDVKDPTKGDQLDALSNLEAALEEATNSGLLDELCPYSPDGADSINRFCDTITDYAKEISRKMGSRHQLTTLSFN